MNVAPFTIKDKDGRWFRGSGVGTDLDPVRSTIALHGSGDVARALFPTNPFCHCRGALSVIPDRYRESTVLPSLLRGEGLVRQGQGDEGAINHPSPPGDTSFQSHAARHEGVRKRRADQ